MYIYDISSSVFKYVYVIRCHFLDVIYIYFFIYYVIIKMLNDLVYQQDDLLSPHTRTQLIHKI